MNTGEGHPNGEQKKGKKQEARDCTIQIKETAVSQKHDNYNYALLHIILEVESTSIQVFG